MKVKELLYREDFGSALSIVYKIRQQKDLDIKTELKLQVLRSLILTHLGEYQDANSISDDVIKESRIIQDKFLEVDALISKANIEFEYGKPTESLKVIESGDKILNMSDHLRENHRLDRMRLIRYLRGKIYRKIGNFDESLKNIQESLSITENISDYEIADSYNVLGGIFLSKGSYDEAKKYLQESKIIFKALKIRGPIVKILNNFGLIYRGQGKVNKALESYEAALKLSIDLNNVKYSTVLSLNIGLIHWEKGEIDSALEYFRKGYESSIQLDSSFEIAVCSSHIGMVYHIKGELDEALRYYENSLKRLEKLGERYHIADCYFNIGEIYYNKGILDHAIEFFHKSFAVFQETENTLLLSNVLFYLILVTKDSGLVKETDQYIKKLEEINNTDENLLISQRYRLSKAYILKESDRLVNRVQAQIIFQNVSREEVRVFTIQVFAMLNLCDLLLLEFKTTGSREVLTEVKLLIDQLLEIAMKNNSYLWLAQAYWLQSKLALIELDIKTAQSLLKRARNIAIGRGLLNLANEISNEYKLLFVQLSKWQKFSEKKPVMNEIIELTQIDDLVERMISKRLYRKEEDVLRYAEKARKIVEKFEKPEQLH
jgi:tetratricopeptide (TPR) repeat protein